MESVFILFTDNVGYLLCDTDSLHLVCPTSTDLKIKQVFELEPLLFIFGFEYDVDIDECNKCIELSTLFESYYMLRYRERYMIDKIQFIPQLLAQPEDQKYTWIESSQYQRLESGYVNSIFHVQYNCEEHVMSFYQTISLTTNYIVLTNSLEIYDKYFYSSSNDTFYDWLPSYNHSQNNDQTGMFCKLYAAPNVEVQYGTQALLVGNVSIHVMGDELHNGKLTGTIPAVSNYRTIFVTFEEISENIPSAVILPIKGIQFTFTMGIYSCVNMCHLHVLT